MTAAVSTVSTMVINQTVCYRGLQNLPWQDCKVHVR